MIIKEFSSSWEAAKAAAMFIAEEARASVQARGRFLLTLSGGRSPWKMLKTLAEESVPWESVQVFQVDERIAPEGHPDRNLTHLRDILSKTPLREDQIHGLPVEEEDLEAGAAAYAKTLGDFAGIPPVLDLIHLGLGVDGHTASLLPGDPVLEVVDRDVALTGTYFGRERMTLTYPILNRARRILWLVTGVDKGPVLARLIKGDPTIPAGRVSPVHATVVVEVPEPLNRQSSGSSAKGPG